MVEHEIKLIPLLWFVGWLVALLILFRLGLSIPLETRLGRWRSWLYAGGVAAAALGICVFANVALVLHDAHLDLTREKVYTPSAAAMRVVDELDREVSLTYSTTRRIRRGSASATFSGYSGDAIRCFGCERWIPTRSRPSRVPAGFGFTTRR